MRIKISAKQQLKEKQASSPYSQSAAEPWQKKFAQQQLHLKQQKRAGKNRESKGQTSKEPRAIPLACLKISEPKHWQKRPLFASQRHRGLSVRARRVEAALGEKKRDKRSSEKQRTADAGFDHQTFAEPKLTHKLIRIRKPS